MSIKRWDIQESKEQSQLLSKETGLPSLLCNVLVSKGLDAVDKVESFLNDEIEFESPFILADMDRATERIHRAVEAGEKIAIYGDYDCDGITSTALMISYFQSVGGDAFYYIPHREEEGYGLNNTALDKIAGQGTTLVVTVDNGISSHAEIAYATTLGMDVVITDHHTPRETLPEAYAVVNPHREDCPSRFKDYAGVGVAFALVCALEGADVLEMLELYGDIVTIGTIADIVPLVRENRVIVKEGLQLLTNSARPGILALLEVAGISSDQPISSENVAFGIAPRLNAAGRMGEVRDAVELLLTDDTEYAGELVERLQNYNLQRRSIEDEILTEIQGIISTQPELLKRRILILIGEGWHPGVMGIVASRLLDQYSKPCFVFSVDEAGQASGSGRSVEGYNLVEAIHNCSERLLHYGGHSMAAGATLLEKDFQHFTDLLEQYTLENYPVMPVPNISVSAVLEPSQLTIENVQAIGLLGPFGCANESPLFLLRGALIEGLYPTRDGGHMRLRLTLQGSEITAIYFRMTEDRFPYQVGNTVDAVVALEVKEWNGVSQLSVRIYDLRRTGLQQEEILLQREIYQRYGEGEHSLDNKKALLPSRDDMVLIFRFLRQENGFLYGDLALYERFLEQGISYGKLLITIDTFEELGLITRNQGQIQMVPSVSKVDLENSEVLRALKA